MKNAADAARCNDVAHGDAEESDDHHAHGGEQHLIDARGGLDAAQIQQREQHGEAMNHQRGETPGKKSSMALPHQMVQMRGLSM